MRELTQLKEYTRDVIEANVQLLLQRRDMVILMLDIEHAVLAGGMQLPPDVAERLRDMNDFLWRQSNGKAIQNRRGTHTACPLADHETP
jgi:hypothetical protein